MHRSSPLHRLRVALAAPWLRRTLRIAGWLAVALYFVLALFILALRHLVLPSIEGYRDDIERGLSQGLGRPVAIRAIDAHWRGPWPNLRIHGLEIRDEQGRPALGFDDVEADIAWSSLWRLTPHFARLEINAPTLDLRRDARGHLFVAGLEVKADDASGSAFPDWLLAQDRIVIRDATITWNDELRQAPPLVLSRLNFDLRNGLGRHRFGLTAEPPSAVAARLDIRGDFRGRDFDALASLTGDAYAELDYADLAGWRAWLDYPFELPRGHGGVRVWFSFDHKEPVGITADLRIADTVARLAPGLPMLEMERVEGRLSARRLAGGFMFKAARIALATQDGVRVEPTDIDLLWHDATDKHPANGEATANGLDVGALAALAAHLPVDAAVREKLAAFGPRGRLSGLRLAWTGGAETLGTYSFKARFEDLGLRPLGVFPGFGGLDGNVEGSEKGGKIDLRARDASIDLPAVFEQSRMAFGAIDAKADWTVSGGVLDVHLRQANFRNADAEGSASGSYRGRAAEPGEIDLSAKLTRASGGAVWRYMPLVVNREVRRWLHDSIVGGAATATLRLKGDLKRFPFADGSGIFEVKGPFHGATLRYAPDWPAFGDVTGDLEFVGPRMAIRARQARLWGVTLADVKAEIPDLGVAEPQMSITGSARGPTSDFLRFIEASPVGERLDHVTAGMQASGGGDLRLRLDMPLARVADTRVDGRYRVAANGLVYDPDLPPLTEINGELQFTGDRLDARKARAVVLGAPMSLDIATEDGRVTIKAAGTAGMRELRQQYGHRLFDHLAGSAPWNCAIRVKKGAAELRFESSLQGISSSLPEPFNKTAGDVLPLVFERKPPSEPPGRNRTPAAREQIDIGLGNRARVLLSRRNGNGNAAIEQGLIAVGRADARLPDRGILLAMKADSIDADFWRQLLRNGVGDGAGGGNGARTSLALDQIDLQAGELLAFGHRVDNLQLTGTRDGGVWKLGVKSREATGRIEWNEQGAGRLTGRLSRLDLAESPEPAHAPTTEATERLPAIDLTVDRFLLKGREIGALRLEAENAEGVWDARFDARSEEAQLAGKGRWQTPVPGVAGVTAIDFNLSSKDVEGMLRRLGYPGLVRRGTVALDASLSWNGAPADIDYPSLAGKLKLEAGKGQFDKLEPGVGRLLGILSLQSLPRRITLDFRDIFSEGFAFDSIAGQMAIGRGILTTSDLRISGPSANVLMNGSVDLGRETQDLKVRVQPAIGETLATSMLLVHPAMGAAAWVMNKLFGSPLDKAFAFDYAITGSWADPKVTKVAAQGPVVEPAKETTETP